MYFHETFDINYYYFHFFLPPLPFFENRKRCPDFGKKVLITTILGLDLPFKM